MSQPPYLSKTQIDSFITDGFLKLEHAFPASVADECRAILWKATGCDPDDRTTWTKPVIRIGELALEPFREAANTIQLHQAFNQLVGDDNWVPRQSLGSFPIRFPNSESAGDTGWHVDAGFPGEDIHDYFSWRINIHSKGRALLMLFLFSDVAEREAPTLIRVGSHQEVARVLAPAGDVGLSFMELARALDTLASRDIVAATGKAGTVYLCHPFLAHAAQDHHGTNPKFMAQPSLLTKHDFDIHQAADTLCPVEWAIVRALDIL